MKFPRNDWHNNSAMPWEGLEPGLIVHLRNINKLYMVKEVQDDWVIMWD